MSIGVQKSTRYAFGLMPSSGAAPRMAGGISPLSENNAYSRCSRRSGLTIFVFVLTRRIQLCHTQLCRIDRFLRRYIGELVNFPLRHQSPQRRAYLLQWISAGPFLIEIL